MAVTKPVAGTLVVRDLRVLGAVTVDGAVTSDGDAVVSLVDAKGDILAGTGADTLAPLAVGTNGKVLQAASGQTTGLQWKALALSDLSNAGTLAAKNASAVVADAAALTAAAAAGAAPDKAEFDKLLADVTAVRTQLNALLAALRTSGVVGI